MWTYSGVASEVNRRLEMASEQLKQSMLRVRVGHTSVTGPTGSAYKDTFRRKRLATEKRS